MSPTTPRKPKSPAAPSRGLKTALDDVKKLYSTYTHGSFAKAEIASTLGMSANSGPFATRLYTLRQYGLLEGSGNSWKVSSAFLDMNAAPAGTAGFKRRALEAIKRSDVFREILTEWPAKLPPRESVATRLEQQKRFNPDKAKEAAGVLEESMKFAGLLDSNNNILPIREDGQPGAPGRNQVEEQEQTNEPEIKGQTTLRTEVPLGEGRKVSIAYPSDLSSQEAQKVGNVLKAIVAES